MSPILGILASAKSGSGAGTSYASIATVTVGLLGAASIDFTSIPSTYTHLQIRGIALGTNQNLITRFNGDTATNYAYHELTGSGSAAAAGGTASTGNPYSGFISTQLGTMVEDILDYTNTNKYKTMRTLGGSDANGSGYVVYRSTLWMNTAAITQVTLSISGGSNFSQYSSFALYGIKGA